MELEQFGITDLTLMDGERIDSAFNLAGEHSGDSNGTSGVMLLTDQRVIHLQGKDKHLKAVFASIQDIDAVEITAEHEGNAAFVWGALAFLVAILLFFVIDHPLGKAAAPLTVALMGLYLIVDRVTSSGRPLVIFKMGSSHVECDLRRDRESSDIYAFINRLFQLKAERASYVSRASHFAPR